jgi:hypothetical protein
MLVIVSESKICQGVEGRVILKCAFKKWEGVHLLDWSDSGKGHLAGYCECGNELRVPKNAGNFLTS